MFIRLGSGDSGHQFEVDVNSVRKSVVISGSESSDYNNQELRVQVGSMAGLRKTVFSPFLLTT